jgi:hypothetical protein
MKVIFHIVKKQSTTLLYITFKVRMKCKEYGITFQVASYLHTKVAMPITEHLVS